LRGFAKSLPRWRFAGFGGIDMRVKTQQDHASIAMTRQIERPRRAVVDPDSSNNVRPP
jgi:hypothetical protein